MTESDTQDNPYEAPRGPSTSSEELPRGLRRFDWRIVPFAVVACLSAVTLLAAFAFMLAFGYTILRLILDGPVELTYERIAYNFAMFAACALTTYCGAWAMGFWQARKDHKARIATFVFFGLAAVSFLCVIWIS